MPSAKSYPHKQFFLTLAFSLKTIVIHGIIMLLGAKSFDLQNYHNWRIHLLFLLRRPSVFFCYQRPTTSELSMTTIYLYFRSFTAYRVHLDQVLRLQADQVARAGKRKCPDKSDLFSGRRRNRFQSGRRKEGTVISRNFVQVTCLSCPVIHSS